MNENEIFEEWTHLRLRWPVLFKLLDQVDLRLSARRCADLLELSSTDELERELRQLGLVRFRLLRDWWFVVRLHEEAIETGSLAQVAKRRGDYQSVLTRFVARVTGRDWRVWAARDSHAMRCAAVTAWHANGLRLSRLPEESDKLR